jgi:uncharacterized SAM-binding protein YcdF (DUF218 family)
VILAADFIRYLLSAGGVIAVMLAASLFVLLSKRSRRAVQVLAAVALTYAILSGYGLQILIARAIVGSLRPFQQTDIVSGRRTAIVVLGTGSIMVEDWDGRTFSASDRSAMTRVLETARVFRMVDPAMVISSGGDPHPEKGRPPTGETMREAMLRLGIPADRIMVETASKTTRDEAAIVALMLTAQGIEQVILVTSETHMRRSLATFRAVGVTAIPAIAQEYSRSGWSTAELIVPSGEGLWFAAANVHELLGIAYYWLRGWVK